MRISKRIGISFSVTFFLVILLGAITIYSLRYIYKGIGQVFSKDLPASRTSYLIAVSMEDALSELNNFLITGNENFRTEFERSYKALQKSMSELRRFIFTEEETVLFNEAKKAAEDINTEAVNIFTAEKKIKELSGDMRKIGVKYKNILGELFSFEENKMTGEKDLLLIQAQYIPASRLIMEISSGFSDSIDGLLGYAVSGKAGDAAPFMEDMSRLRKSAGDYKNYYGYSLSDKERFLATEMIVLSEEIISLAEPIIKLKKEAESHIDMLLVKEKGFADAMDRLLALKKSGIASKLGIGAVLIEDIPAVDNIAKIDKDAAQLWSISGRYILTGDDNYKNSYFQLRQNIDRAVRDYSRHARLKGTEAYLDDITGSYGDVIDAINANIDIFDKKEAGTREISRIRQEVYKKIEELLMHSESVMQNIQDARVISENNIPAMWALIRLKDGFSRASGILADYLSEQDPKYKDSYSEIYFDLKRYVNQYRNLVVSGRERSLIKGIEEDLDEFNTIFLAVMDARDRIVMDRGWTLVKLKEDLKEQLGKAVDNEITQIEQNKKYLKSRISLINIIIFVIIGVVAVIAVFVIFYTANSITGPIQKLYEGAEIIGSGRLDYRLDIKTGDEIQDLADGFNRMAGELKGFYADLENKVKERTIQLAEANNALASKNKELDDFTYIVSHDLKEPLRGVRAFTKLLIEEYSDKLDDEGRGHLKTISESSSRMTRLIEDLLNFSRIGRIRQVEPDVELNEVLSYVKKNLQYSLEEKDVDLKIRGDFPRVMCDRIRISEVFSNLISNAIKYCRKGIKPVVELGCADKGSVYEFYVKDNGIGIDKQYHDKVFQIFQRLHAKGGEYEGTGAGLTIAKKIVENHNGRIWVESEGEGKGSIFYFTLPKA
jgi:signal transduction histidine kinase/CHASE3 domain sensor protein